MNEKVEIHKDQSFEKEIPYPKEQPATTDGQIYGPDGPVVPAGGEAQTSVASDGTARYQSPASENVPKKDN